MKCETKEQSGERERGREGEVWEGEGGGREKRGVTASRK